MSILTPSLSTAIAKIASQKSSETLLQAAEKLAGSYKINSASDDTDALANHTRMASAIKFLGSAIKNANEGISIAQIADAGLSEISEALSQLKDLAVKARQKDLDVSERSNLKTEALSLLDFIDDIGQETRFRDAQLLDGSYTEQTFQVGFNPDETVTFEPIGRYDTLGLGSHWTITDNSSVSEFHNAANRFTSIGTLDLSNAEAALFANGLLTDALRQVNATRARLNVLVNQCDAAIGRQSRAIMNLSSGESRIFDADYAQVTSQLAKTLITQNAVSAMLGHANHNPRSVLSLLKP